MLRLIAIVTAFLLVQPAHAEDAAVLVEDRIQMEYGASLPNEAKLRVSYGPEVDDAMLLNAFWMESATGQFVADVLRETGEVSRISGLAVVTAVVPVPSRQMMPGEIVTPSDLIDAEFPVRRIGDFAVTDANMLIGKQVRRVLGKGRLVMAQSVMAPVLVERGQRVKIILSDGGLNLIASGRALGEAAQGEQVKVVNLVSNLSVVGVAIADGIVKIEP